MSTYTTQLIQKENVADGTMAFYFEKPADFRFKAGQYVNMILINPPETDAEGDSRLFSIASAPAEKNLMFATRMRDSAFKRVLKNMPLGAETQIDGPFGSFTLKNDSSRPIVFLVGGIGITPVRSMVAEAAGQKLPHKLYLFYSNRQPKDSAFLTELKDLEKENQNYKFIPTMTDLSSQISVAEIWEGERGFINKEMLAKYLNDLTASFYYVVGPPAMVAAMREILNGAGVDDNSIKTEEFSGY